MIFWLTTILISATVWANEYQGTIFRSPEARLHTDSGEVYFLTPQNAAVQEALERLESGDKVTLVADSEQRELLLVNHIQFVMLKRLLGTWSNSRAQVLRFVDFQQLTWVRGNSLKPNQKVRRQNFYYTLAPDEQNGWNLFLAQKNRTLIGHIRIHEPYLDIELYDNGRPVLNSRFRRTRKSP